MRSHASNGVYYGSMKRVLGIVMTFLLLNFTLGSNDFACAKHGADAASSSAAVHADVTHHHGDQTNPSHSHERGGATPVAQPCCSAMASCMPTLAAHADATTSDSGESSSRPRSNALAALSRLTAPETPPPRA